VLFVSSSCISLRSSLIATGSCRHKSWNHLASSINQRTCKIKFQEMFNIDQHFSLMLLDRICMYRDSGTEMKFLELQICFFTMQSFYVLIGRFALYSYNLRHLKAVTCLIFSKGLMWQKYYFVARRTKIILILFLNTARLPSVCH